MQKKIIKTIISILLVCCMGIVPVYADSLSEEQYSGDPDQMTEESYADDPDQMTEEQNADDPDQMTEEPYDDDLDQETEEQSADDPDRTEEEQSAEDPDQPEEEQSAEDPYRLTEEEKAEDADPDSEELSEEDSEELSEEALEKDETEPEEESKLYDSDDGPYYYLEKLLKKKNTRHYDIALIDSGITYSDTATKNLDVFSVIDNSGYNTFSHGTSVKNKIRNKNPNASIASIKYMDSDGKRDYDGMYCALQYAASLDVDCVMISGGLYFDQYEITEDQINAFSEVVHKLGQKGIPVFVVAGNKRTDVSARFPACLPEVITIGACDSNGLPRSTSNFGDGIDYYARATSTSNATAIICGIYSKTHKIKPDGITVFTPVEYADPTPVTRKNLSVCSATISGSSGKEKYDIVLYYKDNIGCRLTLSHTEAGSISDIYIKKVSWKKMPDVENGVYRNYLVYTVNTNERSHYSMEEPIEIPVAASDIKLLNGASVPDEKAIKKGEISLNKNYFKITNVTSKVYTGGKITQAPKVTYQPVVINRKGTKTVLKKGTDYTVSYKNSKNAGTATVIITGKGFFSGTLKKTFTIRKRSIASCGTAVLKYESMTYTGKKRTQTRQTRVTAKINKKKYKLVYGKDYKITYINNIEVGTAKMKIIGIGNYKGSFTVTFQITKDSLQEDIVQDPEAI